VHQIGVALHNYLDAHGCFPPGSVNPNGPARNEPAGYHHSWIVQLLPHFERQSAARGIDSTRSIYDTAQAGRQDVLPELLCPSDGGPRVSVRIPAGLTNYAGLHHPVEAPIDVTNHGTLFLNSRVGIADIVDGTASTLIVGEAVRDGNDLGWASGTRATLRNAGTAPAFRRGAVAGPNARPDDALFVGGLESLHRDVVCVLLADGHVTTLSGTIAPRVLQLLADRADGSLMEDF
jgi:hypothetical protein